MVDMTDTLTARADVARLEAERDELVEALRKYEPSTVCCVCAIFLPEFPHEPDCPYALIAKHPTASGHGE